MASSSAAETATWHEGDRCLVPDPGDGTLRQATIRRLTSIFHSDDTTAWVVFTDMDGDEEEEEAEERAVPVSKLTRPRLDYLTQEKPVFASNVPHSRMCVPLELGHAGGDKVPYTINRYLREYQREGIQFIYSNYIHSSGCILGDDMGLGKTVQVIGFLAAVLHKTGTWEDVENNKPQFLQSQIASKHSKPNKVFLIVAPLSVLYNWKDELDTWGYFQSVVVHGLRREEELARIGKGRVEIALTTYETLRLCLDQFNNIDWSAVVVDEAHKIKNPNSQITKAMKDLKCQIRVGLTGTILQNNLEELWCVMDWAVPDCLGSLGHFTNKFSDPIERGQRHNATKRALASGRKAVRALARKISHRFLRRTKSLIKEQLPKKDDRVVYCSLTDFQQTVYQTVLESEDVTLLLRSSEKCDCHSGRTRRRCCYKTNSEGVKIKGLYFTYLTILRKVANHAALLQTTAATSEKQGEYLSAICQKVFQKFPDFVQRCKDEAFEALSDPMYSGKMKVLQKLLKYYLQKRDKMLLFSLSTKLLDVLESYCKAEGLDYSRLDGSTKAKERVQIVKEFNSSSHINICLVSTMAGGLGLNFVGANVVVLFDPTWNPANDLQAIDRAYRIGQCRDVTVLRLISLGTVEEVIYLRQVYKQQLQCSVVGNESARRYFEAVQGHGVHKGELFGIKNLFRLQTDGTCLTRKILEREGRVEAGVMTTSTHTGEEEEEEEEKMKRASEPGDSSTTNLNIEAAKENRDASKRPRGVLDFTSGSEDGEEEDVKRKAVDHGATGPGRMTLLQHGFSTLLQAVKGKPESTDGDSSPDIEEFTSDEDSKNQGNLEKKDFTSSDANKSPYTGNGAECLIKLGTRVDEESEENSITDAKKHCKLKTIVPKVHHVMGSSDESDDLDTDAMTGAKKDVLGSHVRGGRVGRNRKRQSVSVRDEARLKYTKDIETFTSSEDEPMPVKKGKHGGCSFTSAQTDTRSRAATVDKTSTEKQAGASRAVSFPNLKNHTSPASNGKDGTIDSVLGGVAEVAYTHSNQRIVGGSKAEERISRAAIRDVFERKMYSQLPANHVLSTQESLSLSPPDSPPRPAPVRLEKPSLDHPVTFTRKSVHDTRHSTVVIGETPQAIRRQQLEEMAAKLHFPSVHQFAAEVLRSTSSQRLAWLQQYYTSLNHPDLADVVKNNFPQPDSALTAAAAEAARKSRTDTRTPQTDVLKVKRGARNPQKHLESHTRTLQNTVSLPQRKPKILRNDVPEPKEKPKKDGSEPQNKQTNPQKNVLEAPRVPSPESEEQTSRAARGHERTKRASVSTSGASGGGGGPGVDGAGGGGLRPGEEEEEEAGPAASLVHGDAPRHDCPTTSAKPTEQNLSDLLGDTSILDDLFKPKLRGARQGGFRKTPPPSGITATTEPGSHDSSQTQRSRAPPARRAAPKGGHKDFWDILNEGNEESINRLTDPAEVQRVCVNANFAARARPVEEERESLWKKNEKFLWKKL